jgi:glycosyltransferase involved in cell wall biosynthesis
MKFIQNMRILLINTYYYPNMMGGAEHSVYALACGLKDSCECAVFSVDGESHKEEVLKDNINGVHIYRSSSKKFDFKARYNKTESLFTKLRNRFADIYNPAVLKHFSQVLDEFKPDVIQTNGLRGIGPQIWMIASRKHIKVVHTLRDYFVLDPSMKLQSNSLPIVMWRWFFAHYSKYIDILAAPSEYTLNTVQNSGFGTQIQGVVIPNSIVFNQSDFIKTLEEKQQFIMNKTKFLFVGTLGKYKGIVNLIEAFKKIKVENIELVICGSGTLTSIVEAYAKEDRRIIYRGQLSSVDIQKEFKKADVCVVPSLWEEPFGRVVIEAAYNGCAIVVSNRGGIPEIVNKLEAGVICDCNKIDELALAMESLCNSDNRLKQLVEFKKTVSRFSQENYIDLYKKCYLQ